MANTIVFTMVVVENGEGQEPAVTHSLTLNNKPVEGAVAVISVGQLPGVFVSGAESTNEMRQLALQASGLVDRLRDTILGAAISKTLEVERRVNGGQHPLESQPATAPAFSPTTT